MPEPILNCPRVMPFVRQRVAAGMSQHVHMDFEREVGALADALDQPVNGIGGEWGAPFGLEDISASDFSKLTRGSK